MHINLQVPNVGPADLTKHFQRSRRADGTKNFKPCTVRQFYLIAAKAQGFTHVNSEGVVFKQM